MGVLSLWPEKPTLHVTQQEQNFCCPQLGIAAVLSPLVTLCSPRLQSPFKRITSHFKKESLSFIKSLYFFFLPVSSFSQQKFLGLALPEGFIQSSMHLCSTCLPPHSVFIFLYCTSSLKSQFTGFPFLPCLCSSPCTLAFCPFITSPCTCFAHRGVILRTVAAQKKRLDILQELLKTFNGSSLPL